MTRHVSDELLSAYLDDELSSAERAEVEQHLASSIADREMLAELQVLRRELAALPGYQADAGFTERVVAAAVEARDRLHPPAVQRVNPPATQRRTVYLALAATAAAFMLVVFTAPWRSPLFRPGEIDQEQPRPEVANASGTRGGSVSGELSAVLSGRPPRDGEAVVLRLRLPEGLPVSQSIDAALAAAGIAQRPPSDLTTGAMELGAAYRRRAEQNQPAISQAAAAADAIYVEASPAQLEEALAALKQTCGSAPELRTVDQFAFTPARRSDGGEGEGEGDGNEAKVKESGSEQETSFAQRLNAGMFRIQGSDRVAPGTSSASSNTLRGPLRVLILVESAAGSQ